MTKSKNQTDELEIDLEDIESEESVLPPKKARTRVLTNEDILKYEPMVEKYMRDSVQKNWNEAQMGKNQVDIPLGNTGMTMNDIRQHLRAEVCVALYNYNPDYRTKESRSVKESTFVFQHLFNRTGQLMKRPTKKRYGYGVWHSNIEETLWETIS